MKPMGNDLDNLPFKGLPELPDGNVEYKVRIDPNSEERVERLATQMKFRLQEGRGQAFYIVGLADDGIPVGIHLHELAEMEKHLSHVASKIGAKIRKLREYEIKEGKIIVEFVVVQQKLPEEIPVDIKIASIGNVDAGKSTLIGSLLSGELDDGRGKTRAKVFRHRHELESGRTSSVALASIGYDIDGNLVTHNNFGSPATDQFLEKSVKTITFVDLAGHERYLKTTIFGLASSHPDYAMLIVAANQGILKMTKEHLGLSIALNLPLFIIITKIDLSPSHKRKETLDELKRLLRMPGISRVAYLVRDSHDAIIAAGAMASKQIVPIFQVSSVTGEGLNELHQFLSLLIPRRDEERPQEITGSEELEMYVDDIFTVQGVGTVVSGVITQGEVSVNDKVLVGPLNTGEFIETRVKGIHYKRVPIETAWTGMSVTLALHNVRREQIRKGMVVRAQEVPVARRFDAEIYVLYHSTTIKPGYCPVIHLKSIRQAARIIALEGNLARTGDKKLATFEFLYRAERIKEGDEFVFREGRTRGVGKILKTYLT